VALNIETAAHKKYKTVNNVTSNHIPHIKALCPFLV